MCYLYTIKYSWEGGGGGISPERGQKINVGMLTCGSSFQCEGKEYNHKSDVWALGCILYEMASRQKTFEGSNLPALVNKIMKVRRIIISFN